MNMSKLRKLLRIPVGSLENMASFLLGLFWRLIPPGHLARRLMKYDTVSFDIFDTLIFRTVSSPTDVFTLVGKDLKWEGFREQRIVAEKEARRAGGKPNGEIDIFDIYNKLESMYSLDPETGIRTELKIEKTCCYANPYMKAVFDSLLCCGTEMIAVSDMYLPTEFLAGLLEEMGYKGFSRVFVSCECACGKGNGALQKFVSRTIGRDRSIIHIGDNLRADVIASRYAGWHAIWYLRKNFTVSESNGGVSNLKSEREMWQWTI